MLKKLIFLVLLISSVGGIIYSYLILEKKTHLNTPVIHCIPKDAALILHLKKPLSFWSSLSETNLIWNHLKNVDFIKELDFSLKEIDSTIHYLGIQKEKEITFSIHQGTETPSYLLAFATNKKENKLLNSNLKTISFSTYNKVQIHKKESGKIIYTCYLSPFTIISSNETTLQKSIEQLQHKTYLLQDSSFKNLYQKANKSNNFQIYYHSSNLKKLTIPYLKKETIELWNTNGKWSSLDVILDNNQLLLNGLSTIINNNKIIESTKRIDIDLLPTSLQSINEYSFEKEKLPQQIISTINNECKCNITTDTENWLENHLTKIVFGEQKSETAYYIQIKESIHLIEQINEIVNIDTTIINLYGKDIYKLENSSLNVLLNLKSNDLYFCIQNTQLVVSSLQGIKQLCFEWKNNQHTKPSFNYSVFSKEQLAQKSNFNWFTTTNYLATVISSSLKNEYHSIPKKIVEQLQNNFQIGYQSTQLNQNLNHTALIVKTLTSKSVSDHQLWELTLGTPTYSNPQLLKNHRSKSLDVFIQDSTNKIHLINAAGRIKWSKQIDGKFIGNVQQVDIYANNKYQLLFNTDSKIYVIDINGNNVKGFPIKLESKATSPVSIFDYENNNNYRFWISCKNKTTYNYDKEGNKVMGWNMPKSTAPIQQQYTRTVFNQKDYIYTIDMEGNTIFLNRRGENIFTLNKRLNAKGGVISLQKRASLNASSFIFQEDSSYQLIDYSLGNTSQVIELDENHPQLDYKIIDIDNNKFIDYLAVFQNKIELYGMDKTLLRKKEFISNVAKNHNLIKAKNGKYFLVIKEENSDNIIILDAHLNQINDSKILGSLNLSIGDLNSDGRLNVVTVINNETIKVYSLN